MWNYQMQEGIESKEKYKERGSCSDGEGTTFQAQGEACAKAWRLKEAQHI